MSTLRVHSCHDHVATLGPALAAVLWVMGCGLACRGCTSPDTWDRDGGWVADVADVAAWLRKTGRQFLTLSGGEPMDQAPALSELIDQIRDDGDWVVTCYSGYRIEQLREDHRPGSAALVERLDLLIDGPYLAHRHGSLRWRGSHNQRLHDLSGRVEISDDDSAGIQPVIHPDGSFEFIGVFPQPDMFDQAIETLAADGTPVEFPGVANRFPFPTRKEP